MKKAIAFVLIFFISVCFVGCTYKQITITNPENYEKISELNEIRYKEAFDIFPKTIADKDVEFFYFRWQLGIIGSASVEYQCSIKYSDADFKKEVDRIKSYKGECWYDDDDKEYCKENALVYDDETFCLPAYVAILGHYATNAYVLIDEGNNTIHYIYLCIMSKNELHINKEYLPKEYSEFGNVAGQDYSIYED